MYKTLIALICLCLTSQAIAQSQSSNNLEPSPIRLAKAKLENSGFNQDSIQSLVNLIWDTPPKDFRGLVVIKDNQLVIEEYFHTFWRNTVHDIRSAGKSITAMLLGVAIQKGLVQNIDQSVYEFFPKSKYPFINEDYKNIKLRDLLNMASGLDADTDNSETPGHAAHWIAKDSWKEYLLQVPIKSQPGKQWVYADINALLIGMVIEERSGMSLKDFAQKHLFGPLDITDFYWYTNESNQTGAAGNLYLRTLDFAKLGLLIANHGQWDGLSIIGPDYINELHSKTLEISEYNPYADHYGLMWYKSRRTFGDKTYEYLFASGNGGNHLVIFPNENMVMALTSSAYGPGPGHRRSYNIMKRVLSALN